LPSGTRNSRMYARVTRNSLKLLPDVLHTVDPRISESAWHRTVFPLLPTLRHLLHAQLPNAKRTARLMTYSHGSIGWEATLDVSDSLRETCYHVPII
jgi:hypothetical protein